MAQRKETKKSQSPRPETEKDAKGGGFHLASSATSLSPKASAVR